MKQGNGTELLHTVVSTAKPSGGCACYVVRSENGRLTCLSVRDPNVMITKKKVCGGTTGKNQGPRGSRVGHGAADSSSAVAPLKYKGVDRVVRSGMSAWLCGISRHCLAMQHSRRGLSGAILFFSVLFFEKL